MLIYLQRLLPSPKHQSSLSPFPARPQGFQSQTSLAAAVVDAALENYHRQMLCPSPVSLLGGDLSTLFINHTATHFAVPRMLAMHISAVQKLPRDDAHTKEHAVRAPRTNSYCA